MVLPDDYRGLMADGAKVVGGLIILAAGLVITLRLSKSDARLWLLFMGFPVVLVATLGVRFPPRRLNVNQAALVAAGVAATWMAFGSLRGLLLQGLRSSPSILFAPLLFAFVTYFMFWAFLGPLHAAIKATAEAHPPLWAALACSLLGYLVGGGGLMGVFALTNPIGLDLAVFFLPLLTGIMGAAGVLYALAQYRKSDSSRRKAP